MNSKTQKKKSKPRNTDKDKYKNQRGCREYPLRQISVCCTDDHVRPLREEGISSLPRPHTRDRRRDAACTGFQT
jgi:hypothetical protein